MPIRILTKGFIIPAGERFITISSARSRIHMTSTPEGADSYGNASDMYGLLEKGTPHVPCGFYLIDGCPIRIFSEKES